METLPGMGVMTVWVGLARAASDWSAGKPGAGFDRGRGEADRASAERTASTLWGRR